MRQGKVSVKFDGKTYSLDLGQQAFDWNNMLDNYFGDYSEAEAAAVAYLMKACGYSVNMSYGTESSGATSYYVGSALINNLGYNKNISYEQRLNYDAVAWNQMVYDELAAGRPVYYAGHSAGGGHAFICDGYDGNGYFHIITVR